MTRLSDLFAPPWTLPVGEEVWEMLPLSLSTLAQAEGRGIFLEDLQAGDVKAWSRFLAFLARRSEEDVLEALNQYPLALEAFQRRVLWAFGVDSDDGPRYNHRKVKNPLKDNKEEVKVEPTDFGFLVTLSRASGIALSDLSRMSLRGIQAIEASLKELPPMPKLL